MQNRHHRRLKILLLIVGCFFLILFHTIFKFERNYLKMELNQKQQELQKTAMIKAESVQKKYEGMVGSLQALAENVKGLYGITEEEFMHQLTLLAQVGYFDYVGASDDKGHALDSKFHSVDISDREYFKEAMNGQISISDVLYSHTNEKEEVQILAVPIEIRGRNWGIVFGVAKIGTMDRLLENETGSDIYTQIVDSKGNYITRVQTKDSLIRTNNVWDDFRECEFLTGSSEKIREDIANGRSDSFVFRMGEEERVSFYMPLDFKGYYVFSTINSEYIREWSDKINRKVFYMVVELGVAFGLLLLGLIWFNRKVKEELQESHAEALSSAQMMKIAILQSQQSVFEYDRKTKVLWKKAGAANELFLNDRVENMPDAWLEKGMIAEESIEDFKELFDLTPTEEVLEKLIQMNGTEEPKWFRIIVSRVFDEHHQLIKNVGIVDDVTEQVLQQELFVEGQKENAVLKQQVQYDELTGLYNAATLKRKIQAFLDSPQGKSGTHLFLLLDLDNFKQINDTFGHQYGDQVLKDVAQILQKKFRHHDILGRLGGDEFIIFLTQATSYEVMEPAFLDLSEKLQRVYTKNEVSVEISASFGIVEAPRYGTKFAELYEKSDQVLYEVKRRTKNGFQAYNEV